MCEVAPRMCNLSQRSKKEKRTTRRSSSRKCLETLTCTTASTVVFEIATTRPRTVFPRFSTRLSLDDFSYTIGNRLNHTIKISIFPNTLDCVLNCVFLKPDNDDDWSFFKASTVTPAFRNYPAPGLNFDWKFMFDCGDRIIIWRVHIPQNNLHPL